MPIHHDDEVDLIAFLRLLWASKYIIVLTNGSVWIRGQFIWRLTATAIYSANVVVARVSDANTAVQRLWPVNLAVWATLWG